MLGAVFILLVSIIIFHPSSVGWRVIIDGWWRITRVLIPPQIGLAALAYNFHRKKNAAFAKPLLIFIAAIQVLGIEAILQYRVAGWSKDLYSGSIVRADQFLLFDWVSYVKSIRHVPDIILEILYMSFNWIEIIGLVWLAFVNFSGARRYLIATTLTLLITLIIFGLFPVLDAASIYHFNYDANELDGAFQSDWALELVSTQAGSPHLQFFTPLISFPSFHAAGLTLLCWYFRHEKLRNHAWIWAFLVMLTLPARGFHYLTDILAGIAVAGVAIWVVDFRMKPLSRDPDKIPS